MGPLSAHVARTQSRKIYFGAFVLSTQVRRVSRANMRHARFGPPGQPALWRDPGTQSLRPLLVVCLALEWLLKTQLDPRVHASISILLRLDPLVFSEKKVFVLILLHLAGLIFIEIITK